MYQVCDNNGIITYVNMLCLDAAVSPVFGLCFDKFALFVVFTASNCDGFWESLESPRTRISLSLQISVVC
jgi:hypothetical protein